MGAWKGGGAMETGKRIRLNIKGMTCVNCSNKIERALGRLEGVLEAKVSFERGTADVRYDEEITSADRIIACIQEAGYQVVTKEQGRSEVLNIICLMLIIVLSYILLQGTGLLNLLAPGRLADPGMSYGMLFVIGLATSVHCIAMCGGINLSQCLPTQGEKRAAMGPSLLYNLGRVTSYTAMGLILGTAGYLLGGGRGLSISPVFQGALKILAGLFMVSMGVSALGLFPGIKKLSLHLPKGLARTLGKAGARSGRPFVIGFLNGFMPCGPLQSMWLVALAAASPLEGALSMLLFSLGTVPLMLGLGTLVFALGKRFTQTVSLIGGVLVVVLGLAMLSQGGALSGWLPPDLLLALIIAAAVAGVALSIPTEKRWAHLALRGVALAAVAVSLLFWGMGAGVQVAAAETTPTDTPAAKEEQGVQEVYSVLRASAYPDITVQVGIPVRWTISAPAGSINGCNNRMIIREYGIEYTFHEGDNVIEFTPTKVGTVRYSCWMGMIHASIYVVEAGQEAPAQAAAGSVPVPAEYSIPTDQIGKAVLTGSIDGSRIQTLTTTLTAEGFSPAVLVVQKGVTLYWDIENQGEALELVVPSFSTSVTLEKGMNRLSAYPSESFDVATGDGRFFAYVKVVDDLSAVDEAALREEVCAFCPMIYPEGSFDSATRTSCCCRGGY